MKYKLISKNNPKLKPIEQVLIEVFPILNCKVI